MIKKLLFLLLPLLSLAAKAEVPQITSYYPAATESPQKSEPSSTKYIYFTMGSKIVSAKAQLIQNGEVLGTVMYKGTAIPAQYGTMKDSDPDNTALSLIQPGEYTIQTYEVTYKEGDATLTYSDVDNPLGSVTYLFVGEAGSIVSESGLEDKTLLSYYQPDATDGVKTYTFSKAVVPDRIYVEVEYGFGDMPYITSIPWTLSDDGLTLTIDFRGLPLNPTALAYGNVFYDEQGNPMAPPSVITLNVGHLDCVDGTKIRTVYVSEDGLHSTTLDGKIFALLQYQDISFPTPVLKEATFFAESHPAIFYPTITEGCDMMTLTIENAQVLERFDITYTSDDIAVTTPYEEITAVTAKKFRSKLPAEIIACGSDRLVISLTNYEFNQEPDGVDHIIKPLNIGNVVKEYASVAEVKALATGEKAILNVPGGVKVTLSNDEGYCFLEDENDGLMIVTADYSKVLQESVRLTGKLAGTYQGGGMFMVNAAESDYTEVPMNTAQGILLTSLDGIDEGRYDYRLVTFVASESLPIGFNGDNLFVGGTLLVVTDFAGDVDPTEKIENITGVVYNDPSMGQPMLIIRALYDINQELTGTAISAAAKAGNRHEDVYTLTGIKTKATAPGLYISKGKKVIIK